MAQSTILAAGTTVATSTSVTVAAGSLVTLGLFVASGAIPPDASFLVNVTTPGAALPIGSLNNMNPTMVIPGPCAVTVTRNSPGGAGTSVGVFAESSNTLPVDGQTPAAGNFGSTGYGMIARDANSVSSRPVRAGVFGDLYIEGGSTIAKLASAGASNNATLVKGSAGKVYAVQGFNANAAARWVKLTNKATLVVPGTDAPTLSLYCPPTAPFFFPYPSGIQFTLGINYSIVTGAAELDNTAVTAGDILNLQLLYT